ncbi:unnamed protein product [Hymenolepis diminuta]|uniref:PDZ domain-containing protein n=1 Tax=Hymenolepis diminuta TaxID=6216 RepID=A0A564YZM0_HYMDI|nr:unnamed protein product [Hymenolepis diminuta]
MARTMLGKVQLNLPWITKNYEPFLNEECEDFEDLSNKDEFEIEDEGDDNNVYSLPPSASSSVCLPPNPDPPPFDVLHEPLVIESRGGKANKSPSTQVDPFYADSLRLQEEILSPGGIEIYISAHDLLKNIAVIELENCLWIGGWNQRVLNLHNLFHLGDMLISVNGHEVNTLRQFKKTVEMTKRNAAQERQRAPDAAFNFSSEVKCWLRLRRLPLAKTLIVCRQVQDEKIGISFDDKGTNKVKNIDSDGALACTGLPALAQSFMRKSSAKSSLRFLTPKQMASEPELVPWTATEINHRLLNPLFKKHEADLLIGARGMEISVTFQPSDFMEAICKKLRKSRFYQSFF